MMCCSWLCIVYLRVQNRSFDSLAETDVVKFRKDFCVRNWIYMYIYIPCEPEGGYKKKLTVWYPRVVVGATKWSRIGGLGSHSTFILFSILVFIPYKHISCSGYILSTSIPFFFTRPSLVLSLGVGARRPRGDGIVFVLTNKSIKYFFEISVIWFKYK